MLSTTRILIGVAVVAVGLAAWEYARVEARPRIAPETTPGDTPRQGDTPQAPRPVRVTSPLAGTVSAVYVAVDKYVTMGQALALIDSPMLRTRLDAAKADLEMERSAEVNAETAVENLQAQLSDALSYKLEIEAQVSGGDTREEDARSMLERREEIYKAGVLAPEEHDSDERNYGALATVQARLDEVSQWIDDAQRRTEAASGKVEQVKADVRRCELAVANAEAASGQRWILAPVDGKMTAVNVQIGQSVDSESRGPALFEIAPGQWK